MGLSDGMDAYSGSDFLDGSLARVNFAEGHRARHAAAMRGLDVPQVQGADLASGVLEAYATRFNLGGGGSMDSLRGVAVAAGATAAAVGAERAKHRAEVAALQSDAADEARAYERAGQVAAALAQALSMLNAPPYSRSLSLPVATDVWYLFAGQTVIPVVDRSSHQVNEGKTSRLQPRMLELIDKAWSGIKPLRRPENASEITSGFNNGRYTIKAMRYENWNPTQSMRYAGEPSYYNKIGNHAGINEMCGYLAFPVGPMGVMQTVSIIVPELTDRMRATGFWREDGNIVCGNSGGIGWGGLFPPVCNSDDNTTNGIALVESMYKVVSSRAEYPALPFLGYDVQPAHQWLRYYLSKSDVWPMPGTPVFLAVKPSPLHCWWYQETAPLVCAGNYFDTEHYTSGIVKRVLGDSEKDKGEIAQILLVEICGEEFYVRATDWYPYQENERVALLKSVGGTKNAYHWGQAYDMIDEAESMRNSPRSSSSGYTVFENFRVVPISFYEEE